jgi:hypothetical protein
VRIDESSKAVQDARSMIATSREIAGRLGLATIGFCGLGLTGAMHLFGATPLCMTVIDNPGLVDAYLEHEHRINLRVLEVLSDGKVDMVRRNGFYETADFYGPAMLERFLGGRLRREADAARAAGMLSSYTIHTGVMPILDYLAGLTFDSLFGIDVAFKDANLAAMCDKLAARASIWTGPSSTYHLWNGPEATRQAVREVFQAWGRRGLILTPCVSAHCIMPWESTVAMIDEWRKLRAAN